jgi:hypothetical protein
MKSKTVKKSKPLSVSKLKQKVWCEVSKYVRQSNADWRGFCICVTCGKQDRWQSLQAGHFIQGRRNSVVFDLRHIYPQCVKCNVFMHGNLVNYYPFMIKKHGEKVIEELKELNRQDRQFTVPELGELLAKYKNLNGQTMLEMRGG